MYPTFYAWRKLVGLPHFDNKTISDRIIAYPNGQYVLRHKNMLVAVLYTQRIRSTEELGNYDIESVLKLNHKTSLDDGLPFDPILRFHASHGATIVRTIPNFRPKDLPNQGYGVLVQY
eukprot:TRINITY_DN17670_c0_g2_i1.p1 TRINITY_DN17670_c0_g2~~TRINITY_DN17670_c0_g2_i1.p1  ORF type:complete len:118 (+),score=1.22 TRINITY_DN17670_c0_g2_i1:267-620(+)